MNVQINLGRVNIFTILNLQIYRAYLSFLSEFCSWYLSCPFWAYSCSYFFLTVLLLYVDSLVISCLLSLILAVNIFFLLFLVNLARVLLILLVLSRNHVLISLIFFILPFLCFLFHWFLLLYNFLSSVYLSFKFLFLFLIS